MGHLHPTLSQKNSSSSAPTLAWQQLDQAAIKKVEQRVIKQLLQALIYEEVIATKIENGMFVINAKDQNQKEVQYFATGKHYLSFGLVRMSEQDVIRQDHTGQRSIAQLNSVVDEIVRVIPNAAKLEDFIYELKRTFIHDVQSQHCQNDFQLPAAQHNYDVLETYLMAGHPYHPCYKSRVGFSLQDNLKYGVEYAQPIHLVWLAIHQSLLSENASVSINVDQFLQQQLTEKDVETFNHMVTENHLNAAEYTWLPVHPWQWESSLVHTFFKK